MILRLATVLMSIFLTAPVWACGNPNVNDSTLGKEFVSNQGLNPVRQSNIDHNSETLKNVVLPPVERLIVTSEPFEPEKQGSWTN